MTVQPLEVVSCSACGRTFPTVKGRNLCRCPFCGWTEERKEELVQLKGPAHNVD